MSAVTLSLEANAGDLLVNEAGILPRAHVLHIIVAAGKDEVVQSAAATLKPRSQRLAGRFDDFELHAAFDLLLHYNRAIPDPAADDYVAAAHLDGVAAAQLAIDRKVEKSSVPEMPVLV